MKKNAKKKGFTLVELIAVIAVLGILAAVAIPNFTNLQNSSKVKADAATAAQIVKAARIQEADTGTAVGDIASLDKIYYETVPTPQSGGTFALSGGGTDKYVVTWEPTNTGKYDTTQTVTEGTAFTISKKQ